ncbi:MAG: hypothetical protein IJT20_04965 [Synergistaceae bacterium]|nr:hypothetical protein [Synergistaceae bacterium]
MSLKNEMPNLFRKGHSIHRRNHLAVNTVSERAYSIRYGEKSATLKNSPKFQTVSQRRVFSEVRS